MMLKRAAVIPGRRAAPGPESIPVEAIMDSGFAGCAGARNDVAPEQR